MCVYRLLPSISHNRNINSRQQALPVYTALNVCVCVCVCLESIWRSFDNLYVSVSVEVYMNIQGCDLSRTYIFKFIYVYI